MICGRVASTSASDIRSRGNVPLATARFSSSWGDRVEVVDARHTDLGTEAADELQVNLDPGSPQNEQILPSRVTMMVSLSLPRRRCYSPDPDGVGDRDEPV